MGPDFLLSTLFSVSAPVPAQIVQNGVGIKMNINMEAAVTHHKSNFEQVYIWPMLCFQVI